MKFIPLSSFERINSLLECVEQPFEHDLLFTLHLEAFTCRNTKEEKEIANNLVAYYNEVLTTPPLAPCNIAHAEQFNVDTSVTRTLTESSDILALPLPPLVLGSTHDDSEQVTSTNFDNDWRENSNMLPETNTSHKTITACKDDADKATKSNFNYNNSEYNSNTCWTNDTINNKDEYRIHLTSTSSSSISSNRDVVRKHIPFTVSDIDNRLIYFVAALNSVYGEDGYDFSVLSENDFVCYDENDVKGNINQHFLNLPEKCLPALHSLWSSIEEQVLTGAQGCEYYEFNCPSCDPLKETAVESHHYFFYNKKRKVIVLMRLYTERASHRKYLISGNEIDRFSACYNNGRLQHNNKHNNKYNYNENNESTNSVLYNNDDDDDDDNDNDNEDAMRNRELAWKKENVYSLPCDDDDDQNDESIGFSSEYD